MRLIDEIVRMTDLLIIELTNYYRFTYSSFRLPSVRLRLEPIRLRPIRQFAYVLNPVP